MADSVLIRYLRLGVDDGHIILMASQDDATAQSVFCLLHFDDVNILFNKCCTELQAVEVSSQSLDTHSVGV